MHKESSGLLRSIARIFLVACLTLQLGGLAEARYTRVDRDAAYNKASSASQILDIAAVQMDTSGNSLRILATRNIRGTGAAHYSMIKLSTPNRVVIDIPNARLGTPDLAKMIPVHQNGIEQVEVSQPSGTLYNAVRVVVYVSDNQALWKMNTRIEENSLLLNTGIPDEKADKPAAPIASSPWNPPAGRQIIESVRFKGDKLLLQAKAGSVLRIKNRFPLNHPDRLVIELENTAVENKSLQQTFSYRDDNGQAHAIRVGQFDDSTVRVVIETSQPDRFQMAYPGTDKSLIAIGTDLSTSVSALPADVALGQLSNIIVGKRDGQTTIRLASTTPIVHRLTRKGNLVMLDLVNVSADPRTVSFLASAFPELDRVKLEALNAGQPNSKLVVRLKQPDSQISTDLAEDGKTLDLVFAAADVNITLNGSNATGETYTAKEYAPSAIGRNSQAPYAARIVVDAGHGGKDIGANRNGVNEKDLNLQMATRLTSELTKRGFRVYMTRSSDMFLPLPQITGITNQVNPDLFISIHQNASVNAGLNGIETYYFTPQSLPLARKVHASLINTVSAPDRGVRQARFYVIHHTDVPAILCEVGYISNAEERQQLQSAERQNATAAAIAEGVVTYLKSRVAASAK